MALLILLLAIPAGFWEGFAITRLWDWFIVPLGLGSISTPHAAGIAVLIAVITQQVFGGELSNEYYSRLLCAMILLPSYMLGMGWLFHSFM